MEFLKLLQELKGGVSVVEAENALAEVVAAVKLTGKKGSLTIKIEVTPADKHAEVLGLSADVVAKAPKPENKIDIFFPTEDGRLSRNHAKQMTLDDLKKPAEEKPASVTPLRKV